MLFYEWRSGKGEQRNHSESPTSLSPDSSVSQIQETIKADEAQASTSDHIMVTDEKMETTSELIRNCDKESQSLASTSSLTRLADDEMSKFSSQTKVKRKSLLNKELEDWIWQDNRHYLEDRNIFEHTYFK